MKIRQLGQNGPQVSAIGSGCMGLVFGYANTVSRAECIGLIRAAFERGFYPARRGLVTELGLRDAASLDAAERLFTDTRIEEGMPARASEPTYAGFKAIPHHLVQDLYAWAGQERTYTTGRGHCLR